MTLKLLPKPLAICRLPPEAPVPEHVWEASFCAVTHTPDELSIIVPEALASPAWRAESGWRAMVVAGPLAFDVVGVVAALSAPLAAAGIPIFVVSTYDTDYLLVKEETLAQTTSVLEAEGHHVDASL